MMWFKKRSLLKKWMTGKYSIHQEEISIGDYVTTFIPKLMKVDKIKNNIVTCTDIETKEVFRLYKNDIKQVKFD